MNQYEAKLKEFIKRGNVDCEYVSFKETVHTVEDACRATGAQPDAFVKTICMIDENNKVICALVLGSDRASTSQVAKALKINRPAVASPEQALKKTGYLVGGTPPFGYEAIFLIDPTIMEKKEIYVGGGHPNALIRITPQEVQRINKGIITKVRK